MNRGQLKAQTSLDELSKGNIERGALLIPIFLSLYSLQKSFILMLWRGEQRKLCESYKSTVKIILLKLNKARAQN
jgi:hypothetical protein